MFYDLLYICRGKQTGQGLYFEGDQLFLDSSEDWEKFWGPLGGALVKRMECRVGEPGRPI
jgi:hypothetical protein